MRLSLQLEYSGRLVCVRSHLKFLMWDAMHLNGSLSCCDLLFKREV